MKHQSMTDALTCVKGPLECIRYFSGQLITPAEMNQEQDYFRQKLRLHNRMLHGWGVVCGALVCTASETDENNGIKPKPWHITVKPGYIVGPYGDDICIDCTHEVDLRSKGLIGVTGEDCEQALDPWCSEVTVKRDPGPLYIAVKYKQTLTRPVRVQPVGCGCDETQCEYSRCRDGYEICILDECPESHRDPIPDVSHEALFGGPNPPCPECPAEPWVVLAEVEVNEDGTIERIDNCSCRRVVISFGSKWWRCEGGRKGRRVTFTIRDENKSIGPGETRTVEELHSSLEDLPTEFEILESVRREGTIVVVIDERSGDGLFKATITNNRDKPLQLNGKVVEISPLREDRSRLSEPRSGAAKIAKKKTKATSQKVLRKKSDK